jgi:hypothetical protein
MTQHPLTHVASVVVVGALMSAGAVGAQTVTTTSLNGETPEPNGHLGRHDIAQTSQQRLMQHDVAPPSSDFTTYLEGALFRVSIPSNWRELPGFNAVTFAPDGAYGNVGAKSVFTHGLGMGIVRNDKRNLRVTTDAFIESSVLVNPSPGRTFRYSRVTIGDRPGLHIVLSSASEATGELERIEMFTTLLRDGTFFYVLAVAPRDCAADYAGTFRRVMGSIQIVDCARCAQ